MERVKPKATSAQPSQYNPVAIADYYRAHPVQVVGRTLSIFWSFALFLGHQLWDHLTHQVERNKLRRASELRQMLIHLGPTFIKVGQALSTRPDLIRKDYLEELIKLQDQLPPFDNALAFQIIEKELGIPASDAYLEISPQPVAAASLGQVYRAILHTGEEVAVKVQRPNLRQTLNLDLFLLRWASKSFAPLLPLNLGHDLTLIVDEFGIKLYEEIDYVHEGHNAEKFAANFLGDNTVKVPAIYWQYSSERVLTLEWIQGVKLTNAQDLEALGIDPQRIIKIGVTSGLRQLLEHGFFHADPHPGNLFATPDGRMAFIDFGMMDQLEESTKETLASSVVQLINQDYNSLAEDFVRLGFLTGDVDIKPIIPALERVLGNAIGQSVGDFNFKTITDDFSELMFEYPFRVPAKFALIIRSLVTQEGLALSLDPNFKIVEVAYPFVARRLLTGESAELRRRLLDILFKDGKLQWHRLENMLAIARSDESFDLLPTARLGFQYLLSEEGRYLRRQLLLAMTEDDRLHTAEVQRLWELIKDDLQPRNLFDVAINTIRELSTTGVAALLPTTT
jgi:predicted unusual protein kinase regulating ubiquinone biosynthesis (AarF/ABC1/UbiB family)